jgi:hypothetical protein
MKRIVIAMAALCVLAVAACSSGSSPASQIPPGSKTVPCSQFLSQLKQILPLYTTAFYSGDSSHLYESDVTLANKFGNVSNLDPPASLSAAEVAYESDVLNGGYITQNQPFSSAIETDVQALATACGLVEITGTWVPSPSSLPASR